MLRFEELPEVNSERWLSLEDLPDEEWKPVVGYEGKLAVSNYSRIKSLPRLTRKTERIIRPHIGPRGYFEVHLYEGKRIHKKVHRIMMEAFVPNPENKNGIDHIDTNKLNNSLDNLRWATSKENTNNSKSLPRIVAALKRAHLACRKPVVQKTIDNRIVAYYGSISEAGMKTGINKSSIGCVARKRIAKSREGWAVRNLTAGGYKWEYV